MKVATNGTAATNGVSTLVRYFYPVVIKIGACEVCWLIVHNIKDSTD